MEHINIFGLVLFLIAGAWSAAAVHREKSVFAGDFLEAMWKNLICYIAYNLYMTVLLYALENVPTIKPLLSSQPYRFFHGMVGNALMITMTYYFCKMVFKIGGKNLPPILAKGLPLSFILPFVATIVRVFVFPTGENCSPERVFLRFFMMPLHSLCLGSIVWLVLWNRKRPKGKERTTVTVFALFQVICFLFYIDTATYYLPFLHPWPALVSILYNRGTEIIYALTPWIWLKFFYIPLKKDLWSDIRSTVDFESFHRDHELTKREVEVLGLLVEGRSYRQIGETLFISVNTVKNHAYSLFRKLDVSSQHELIGKVGDYGRSTTISPELVQ